MGRLWYEAPGHLAARSQTLAAALDNGLIWRPKQCAALNALDQVWRELKGQSSAHDQHPMIDAHAAAVEPWIMARASTNARREVDILSQHRRLQSFLT
jgi:hypothetical protein